MVTDYYFLKPLWVGASKKSSPIAYSSLFFHSLWQEAMYLRHLKGEAMTTADHARFLAFESSSVTNLYPPAIFHYYTAPLSHL